MARRPWSLKVFARLGRIRTDNLFPVAQSIKPRIEVNCLVYTVLSWHFLWFVRFMGELAAKLRLNAMVCLIFSRAFTRTTLPMPPQLLNSTRYAPFAELQSNVLLYGFLVTLTDVKTTI